MNGVESAASAPIPGAIHHAAKAATNHAPTVHAEQTSDRRPGMKGAITLSLENVRRNMAEAGFMDLHAGNVTRMQVFVQQGTAVKPEEEVALDPPTAAAVVAALGANLPPDMNAVLRILARVDPKRVAALLR